MNVSELCVTPSKATNNTNQAMESYSNSNTFREPDQDMSNNNSNNTTFTQSLPVTRYTLPPLSQRHNLQHRLPSLVDMSTSYEESNEESTEEIQTTESTKTGEGMEVKQLIEKCSTLCNDLARYKTWRKGLEKDREAIFDFVTHTAHDILDSLVAMQQQQDAVVSNEAEYEMIRQARNWKENRKPKYRRRSKRNMIGQQCHSCHTSETPEWRRGPDGARTLCNACGLHYSKLLKKESVTVTSYKFLGHGSPQNGCTNNDGMKIEQHHSHQNQNDEQHKHSNHYIQSPPPQISRHQQQQQQQQQQHHHHHHQQPQQPSLPDHPLHHHHHLQHHSSHTQLPQTHPSHQNHHQHQHQHHHHHHHHHQQQHQN